ncbi:zf-C3HC4-domain-containing protein [Lentinula edodes]|uniref:Zf-C3HC4-domain-containing protein n=1 Tax=Lentinula edodes TaxID=5353 RepID=A0A1Q3EFU1_LENED|nr:zf-C3HC4-domain-containing protein [Lentinula edodes]
MSDTEDQKQCRICLDGADAEQELGRLIRPCLCSTSMLNVYRSGGIARKTNQHSFAVECVATHTDSLGRAPSELLLIL